MTAPATAGIGGANRKCYRTEILMQSPSLKDRFIPNIQADEEKIRKVKTEIETRNLAAAPSGVDLLSFRQEMEQALQGEHQLVPFFLKPFQFSLTEL